METLIQKYRQAVLKGPIAAGDFAQSLNDNDALSLLEAIKTIPDLKNKAVKTLWYNYETQQFREVSK